MSGHSKWSQIKRQKGAADVKRGQLFSKLAKLISVAARAGGGDPAMNPRLRMAIETARADNMPKDNIERAIQRGTGEIGGAAIEELRFEAYGPGGTGFVIDVATDNRNRVSAEVKAVLNRHGGKLAATGAVAYQFSELGVLTVPLAGQDRQHLELALIDAGALDYDDQGDAFVATTDPKEISQVKEKLSALGIAVAEVRISLVPNRTVAVPNEVTGRAIFKLIEELEAIDDVTVVTANFDIPAEILDRMSNA